MSKSSKEAWTWEPQGVLVLRPARVENPFVRGVVHVPADVAHQLRDGAEAWLSPG